MSRPVYSRQFFWGSVLPGITFLFSPPVGELWIVKDVSFDIFDDPGYASLAIYDGSDFVSFVRDDDPPLYHQLTSNGRFVVIEAGQPVVSYTDGSVGMGVVVSGYKFTLP